MEQILIPHKRSQKLLGDKKAFTELKKRLKCKIKVEDGNQVVIDGEPYDEYNAKMVLQAFGRGFEFYKAFKLLTDDYFFKTIDLKPMFRTKDQVHRVEARIIGTEGKTKEYIEAVSGIDLSIFGDTVSMIGTTEQMKVAEAAIQVLLEGGTHKKAYRVMEGARRKTLREVA